jgi:uncharacterized membrane protein YkvA (DUF1232 family)
VNERLRRWAKALRREVLLLWLAARDPRVSLPVKLLAGLVVGYALSPIDLIPDFIPVLGLLDDLLLVPAGIWLTLQLIPAELKAELRKQAAEAAWPKPSRLGAALIIASWVLLAAFGWWLWRLR